MTWSRFWFAPVLVALAVAAAAQAETITASFDYQLGDNDSRNDARTICYLYAQQKALQQAGVYIESQTTVRNLQLQPQDVIAFTAAIATVEPTGDRVVARGDAQIVSCAVRITIDPNEMQARLQQFGSDKLLQADLRRQRERVNELETRLEALTRNLGQVSGERAAAIRLERSDVVSDIRSIEAATRSWQERTERNRKLQNFIRQYIKVGMTQEEVTAILGTPARKDSGLAWQAWYYGDAKDAASILFERRFVSQIKTPMVDPR